MRRIVSVVLVFIMVCLSGCGGSSRLIGRWELVDEDGSSAPFEELEIFKDNTYSSNDDNYNGAYSISDDRIKFAGILMEPIACSYEVEGDMLLLYDDDSEWEFVKLD